MTNIVIPVKITPHPTTGRSHHGGPDEELEGPELGVSDIYN
jgi:hypothetical protein